MYALRLDTDGSLLEIMSASRKTDTTPVVKTYPKDIDNGILNGRYYYLNGEWSFKPTVVPPSPAELINTLFGTNGLQAAEQARRVIQKLASSFGDEQALEVSNLFDIWSTDKYYTADEYITYGINSVGDPQLYKVKKAHTSTAKLAPDSATNLFTAVGVDELGNPLWSKPAGINDAYAKDDIVKYNGVLYQSLADENEHVPTSSDWKAITDTADVD